MGGDGRYPRCENDPSTAANDPAGDARARAVGAWLPEGQRRADRLCAAGGFQQLWTWNIREQRFAMAYTGGSEPTQRSAESQLPFRAWLLGIARYESLNHIRKHSWVDVITPAEIIQRMLAAQLQVLALRYVLGFRLSEIASAMGRTTTSIRQLHRRALPSARPAARLLHGGQHHIGRPIAVLRASAP